MPPAAQASSGVASLVASIKQHKKFRQLAAYSVQCLGKVITPPHVGWQRNLKDAYDNGALASITDVLQRHSSDDDVNAACIGCLSTIATVPKYAAEMVEGGTMMQMLEIVMKNPDNKAGVKETLLLLETVASNNPEVLLAQGFADACTRLMAACASKPAIVASCVRVMEKLNKVAGGSQALIEVDGIKTLFAILPSSDRAALEPALRMLDRMCRAPELAEYVRTQCNGLQVLVTALESSKDAKVTKLGGRILAKLASGSVSDLVVQLESGQNTDFVTALLANLAMDEENADRISSAGGLPALIRAVTSGSKKTVENAARTLGRIVIGEESADAQFNAGTVQVLVRAADQYKNEKEVAAAIATAISRLAITPMHAGRVGRSGGVEAVVKTLVAHPEFEAHSLEALSLLDNMATNDFDVSRLAELGAINGIAAALKAHTGNAEMQLAGVRALVYFGTNEANVRVMAKEGVVERALALVNSDKKDVVVAAMYLATSLAMVSDAKAKIGTAGTDTLLNAVSKYARDELVRSTASELLSALVPEDSVAEAVADLGIVLDDLLESKSKPKSAEFKSIATRVAAYAATKDYAELIIKSDGIASLVKALEDLSTTSGVPDLEAVLQACSRSLVSIAASAADDAELRRDIAKSGAIKAAITSIKANPKLTKNVTTAVVFLELMGQYPEIADAISEEGGVEACVSALRANANNSEVVCSAIQTLLQVAGSDKGSVAVAKHGGTRQVFATVSSNTGTPNFVEPMEKSLALLQRVSQATEGAEMLVKQGGVDAVISATEYLSKAGSTAAAGSGRVLSRLLTKDDVINAVDQVNELGNSAKRNRVPAVDVLKPALTKIGHMATVGSFSDTIVAEGGAKSIAALVGAIMGKGEEAADAKAEALPLAFKAFANIGRNAVLDPSLGISGFIAQAIDGAYSVAECLECIAAMASGSEAGALSLCQDGRTINLVIETLKSNIRNKEVAPSCFRALAALSAYASSASIVASTPAYALVSGWVDDNIDDASGEAVESALAALAGMANAPAQAAAMLEGGAVELIKTVLTKAILESDRAVPAVLGGSVSVLVKLGADPNNMARISAAGALRRVLRAAASGPAYVKDEPAMVQTLDLIVTSAAAPGVVTELTSNGALDVIIAAINANGTAESVVSRAARALAAVGAGPELATGAIEDVARLTAELEKASVVTDEAINQLGDAVQRVGTFLLIPGVVTPATAGSQLSQLSSAVALLGELGAPPAVIAAGVQAIGRVISLGGPSVEASAKQAVEMVMDVMAMTDSSLVKESCSYALGALANNQAGLKAITEVGAINVISQVARSNAGDAKLQTVVNSAMTKITSQTSRAAASLVTGGQAGSATLAAVVQANASDATQLTTVLNEVSAVVGGDEAIYDVIAQSSTSTEVMVEALRVLRERAEGAGKPIAGNGRRLAGLTRALASALTLQSQLTAASDMRTKLMALRLADNTLALLARVQFDATGAPAFFAGNGIDNLMQLLGANIEDEETVARITAILRSAMSVATVQTGAVMAQSANMGSVVGTLKLFTSQPNGASIVADCVEIMAFTARALGADHCGIDREGMRGVSAASVQFPSDARIRGGLQILQSVLQARFSEADAQVRAMDNSLKQAAQAAAAVATIQELVDASGKTYYYNSASGETTWEMPSNYAAFKNAMTSMQQASSVQQEDAVVSVDNQTIITMVNTLNTHMRNPAVCMAAAQTLATLAVNDANADAIARAGGIRTVLASAMANAQHKDLVKTQLILLERISRNDTYKEQIVDAGAVDFIAQVCIGMHVGDEEVALKALATMANLAFGSPNNIEVIMKKAGVKSVEKVLQTYPKHPRILENAMCALSNLMFGSDDNKLTIGQTCGDEVTNIIRDHPNDGNLFKMALRALGNLSFCDENIKFIVEEHHAVKAIVAGMRANKGDEEAQQLAMEVIGNFASLEEPAPETDAEGNVVNARDSVSSIILREAGCAQIIQTLAAHSSNAALIKAGLDALANIANDVEVTEVMAKKQNLVPTVIEVMQANDWDVEVITRAVALIGVMTYSRECLVLIAQLDGLQVLLSAMEQHGGSPELLTAAQVALTNLASAEEARTAIRNMEGVSTILALLESNITDKNYVTETCKTLTRLCADDRLSSSIADRGMHILMAAIDRFSRDAEFLTVAFRLLGHLAFVESNLTVIVQHNGIHKVVSAISVHPDSQPLMVRSIQTLDNIAMANKENAAIVIEEGGRELIETIMETYKDDDEITRYGKSALLSMSALENLSKSAEITAKAAKAGAKAKKVEDKRPVDPLAEYRHTLSAGKVMKVWVKGSSRAAHVVISPDFKSIVWQEVGTQKKLGAMDLRTVAAVRAGNGEGHKKGMLSTSKAAEPENTFVVVGDRSSLDLEANSVKERTLWVDALTKLLQIYRTNPSAL